MAAKNAKSGNYNSPKELKDAVYALHKKEVIRAEIAREVGVSATTVGRIVYEELRIYNRKEAASRSLNLIKSLNKLWVPTEVPKFNEELGEYVYE